MKKRIVDPDGMIICRSCLNEYPRDTTHFYRNNRDRYGLTRVCKTCDNQRRIQGDKERKYHNIKKSCKKCESFFYASRAWINKSRKRGIKNPGIYCSSKCAFSDTNLLFRKGSSWNGKRRGMGNPCAKLDNTKIIHIRFLINSGESLADIARLYQVRPSTVHAIKSGKNWAHI